MGAPSRPTYSAAAFSRHLGEATAVPRVSEAKGSSSAEASMARVQVRHGERVWRSSLATEVRRTPARSARPSCDSPRSRRMRRRRWPSAGGDPSLSTARTSCLGRLRFNCGRAVGCGDVRHIRVLLRKPFETSRRSARDSRHVVACRETDNDGGVSSRRCRSPASSGAVGADTRTPGLSSAHQASVDRPNQIGTPMKRRASAASPTRTASSYGSRPDTWSTGSVPPPSPPPR